MSFHLSMQLSIPSLCTLAGQAEFSHRMTKTFLIPLTRFGILGFAPHLQLIIFELFILFHLLISQYQWDDKRQY